MLIVCAGMMRSGSTVQRQVVSALIDYYHAGETIKPVDLQQFMAGHEAWAARSDMVVYKLHQYVDLDAIARQVKVLSTVRDLYDVIVSLAHFESQTIDQTISDPTWRTSLWWFRCWEANTYWHQFHVDHYLDLLNELPKVAYKIGKFLDLPITHDVAQQVAGNCSIVANVRRAEANHPETHPDYMAKRHIYSGKSHLGELEPRHLRLLGPWHDWWAETCRNYLED